MLSALEGGKTFCYTLSSDIPLLSNVFLFHCTFTVPLCSISYTGMANHPILDSLMNSPLRIMGGVYNIQYTSP